MQHQLAFVDYIAANKNDQKIFKKIVEGLGKGCKKSCNANSRRRNCNNAGFHLQKKNLAFDLGRNGCRTSFKKTIWF